MKSKLVSLSNNDDFKNLLKGKKVSNKYFTIFFKRLLNKNNKILNISFVAKKNLGNAVNRNKIKRRLKNIMNLAIKELSINFDYSYLVIAKNSILKDEYLSIKKTLFSDFKKIK